MGRLSLSDIVMSEVEVKRCRAMLVDAALQMVTGQAKLNMQTAPESVLRVSRTMIQRAQALDLDWAGLPSNRQNFGALLEELRAFLEWRTHIPAPWWMLVAELDNITVCVWQPGAARDKRTPFINDGYATRPLVYCPADPQQECLPRAVHILFHAGGYPDTQLGNCPLDGAGVGLRPDHFAYIDIPKGRGLSIRRKQRRSNSSSRSSRSSSSSKRKRELQS